MICFSAGAGAGAGAYATLVSLILILMLVYSWPAALLGTLTITKKRGVCQRRYGGAMGEPGGPRKELG